MKELMKSIESAIVVAVECIEAIENGDVKTPEQIENNAEVAKDFLQEALCNFAQLCNMVEVK